jgi:hypothetical protein
MSRRFRRSRQTTSQAPLTVDNNDFRNESSVNTEPTDSQLAYDGFLNGTMAYNYSPSYPSPHEIYHPMADTAVQRNPVSSNQRIADNVDRTVGGVMGEINPTYAVGVVSSDNVENFALDGRQQIIRRGRNPSDRGPVGTSDHNTMLGLAYAQQVNQYFPNEQSQTDLVRSV